MVVPKLFLCSSVFASCDPWCLKRSYGYVRIVSGLPVLPLAESIKVTVPGDSSVRDSTLALMIPLGSRSLLFGANQAPASGLGESKNQESVVHVVQKQSQAEGG